MELGAKTEKTSFHSLRHNFRDAMSNAGVPEEFAFALGGWKKERSNTGNKYGSRPPVNRLYDELRKVEFSEIPNSW